MTTLRQFTCNDMFRFNCVNLDKLTETYNLPFYLQYMARWPNLFCVAENPSGVLMGYIMGKAEGLGTNWHGHVTAVTVEPNSRRMGLARYFMNWLEAESDKTYAGYFVDLYVRVSNKVAINMYKSFGYVIYRQVLDYYSGEEGAYDMRKSLSKDPGKKAMQPLEKPVKAEEVD